MKILSRAIRGAKEFAMIVGRKIDGKKVGRQAWIALILTVPGYLFGTLVGELIASALGYPDSSTAVPLGVKFAAVIPALAISCIAPLLAAKWGREAFLAGNRQARIPGMVSIFFLIFLGSITLLSFAGIA